MKRIDDPTRAAKRAERLEGKRKAKLRAAEEEEALRAKHKSDKEIHSELRMAGELVKHPTASPKSGRRARKIARLRCRPAQVVIPKPGYEPTLSGEGCHEERTSSYGVRRARRLQIGKSIPTPTNASVKLRPKFVMGHVKYHATKSARDQEQAVKVHDTHPAGHKLSLHNHYVLSLLKILNPDAPTTTVPATYTGKKGVRCVKLIQKPVLLHSKPTAVLINRNGGVGRVKSARQLENQRCRDEVRAYREDKLRERAQRTMGKTFRPDRGVKPKVAKRLADAKTVAGKASVTMVKVHHVEVIKPVIKYGTFVTTSGLKVTVHPRGTLSRLAEEAL